MIDWLLAAELVSDGPGATTTVLRKAPGCVGVALNRMAQLATSGSDGTVSATVLVPVVSVGSAARAVVRSASVGQMAPPNGVTLTATRLARPAGSVSVKRVLVALAAAVLLTVST